MAARKTRGLCLPFLPPTLGPSYSSRLLGHIPSITQNVIVESGYRLQVLTESSRVCSRGPSPRFHLAAKAPELMPLEPACCSSQHWPWGAPAASAPCWLPQSLESRRPEQASPTAAPYDPGNDGQNGDPGIHEQQLLTAGPKDPGVKSCDRHLH